MGKSILVFSLVAAILAGCSFAKKTNIKVDKEDFKAANHTPEPNAYHSELEKHARLDYSTVGCFEDQLDRAIATLEGQDAILDGNYKEREDAINKCYQAASSRGFKVFAVQDGGWCVASATAEDTYNKYGPSSACNDDGEGGTWANQVYFIKVSKRAELPAVADAAMEKAIEVAGKLVDKQLEIIDKAKQKAEDFLKKEIKLDIVPDKGWQTEDMFVPAGFHINSQVDEEEEPPKESGGETPYAFPAGIGGMMMNGCWGTGYTETDPCYNSKINLTACLDMIDGAAFIGTGFDGRGDYGPDSRKMSIIQRNCNSKATYDDLDVPDTMNVHGIYETSSTMHTFEGRSEFQTYLQQEAGMSGSFLGMYGGVKAAFGESAAGSSKKFLSILDINVVRYEIYKDETKPQDLSPTFLKEFMDLPTSYFGIGAPLLYQDFIQRWGTHYIKSGEFGGQLEIRKMMDATDVQNKKEFAVEMEAEMEFLFSSFNAKASAHGGTSQRSQTKTTSTSIVVKGGSHEVAAILTDVYTPTFKNEFKDWLKTIPEYPKPFLFKMAYITDLLNFRAHDLFPDEPTDWGCEGNAAFLLTETNENGEEVKYYETSNGQGDKTKHYCNFDSRQALEDSIKMRRSSLARAVQVYLEEGPISISDFELPACKPSHDVLQRQHDFWQPQQVPSWKDIIKNSKVLRVLFDMKKDLVGANEIITRNMSRMVRFRHGRWFTSGEDGIFHIFNAFPKEGHAIKTQEHKLSILGLWLTFDEADGTLSLLPDDVPLSKHAFPGVNSRIPGLPVASLVPEASNAVKRNADATAAGPCNVQWSNALRFDPTDRKGKCLHFTAASSGPIFVVFSTLPKDVTTWYYVKIDKLKVEIFKGQTLRTSYTNINALALGNPSLLQSYFVCISESDTSTLIEYGKTQGSPESGEIYLNMIDAGENSHVRFYAFGNGVQPARVLDAHIVPRELTTATCTGDTYQDLQSNLCVQKCHKDCDPLAGCQPSEPGKLSPQECTECRVAYDPVEQRCTSHCSEGARLNKLEKICQRSFEMIIRPDATTIPAVDRGFPTLKEWSICLWIRIENAFNFNSEKHIQIVTYQGPNNLNEEWYDINVIPEAKSKLVYTVDFFKKAQLKMTFNEMNDRNWHHLCTTWSGLSGVAIQYLDGERREAVSGTAIKGSFPGGGRAYLGLGSSQVVLLSDFNVWDRVLTAEEIGSFQKTCEAATGNVRTWMELFLHLKGKKDRYNNPSSCKAQSGASK